MDFMKSVVATALELMASKANTTPEAMQSECAANPEMMSVLNKYVEQGLAAYLSR